MGVRLTLWSSSTPPTSAKVCGLSSSQSQPDLGVFLLIFRFSSIAKIDSQLITSWLGAVLHDQQQPYSGYQERFSYAFGPILSSCIGCCTLREGLA